MHFFYKNKLYKNSKAEAGKKKLENMKKNENSNALYLS